MCFPPHQLSAFQKNEHGPHGAWIGRHTPGKFPLGERMSLFERREEHKLVGGDAMRRKLSLRAAVERQVSGSERPGNFTFVGHQCL
jgi:hypothetical protein